jgi:dipeptidyl aminopeptidase/acylaminoacyl peptidase
MISGNSGSHRAAFLNSILVAALVILVPALLPLQSPAQAETTYRMPPQVLADMVDTPRTPSVSISHDNRWLLLRKRPGQPPISEVAQPELRLAGLRINPRTGGRSRTGNYIGLSWLRISDGEEREISGLPVAARITSVTWSPDSKRVAFVIENSDGLTLWSADLKKKRAKQVSSRRLNGVYGRPYRWLPDGKSLVALMIPTDRGPVPEEPALPAGPVIQENLGRKSPVRTYADLLRNPHDEDLFEYHTRSQVVCLKIEGGEKEIGKPGIIRRLSVSPAGDHLLIETVKRPFSYSFNEDDFPRLVEIWNLEGSVVYQAADLPLQDSVPIARGSVPTGRRSFGWRADAAAELYWVEALDGGDSRAEATERDRVFTLQAPFTTDPKPLITLGQRYNSITWGNDHLALASSYWWETRNYKAWLVQPGDRAAPPRLLQDRNWQDRYGDPGSPILHQGKYGNYVLLTVDDGKSLFLIGNGASPEGDRPFLDRMDLESGETRRLFHSQTPWFERPVELLDPKKLTLITRRESKTEPPNYFVRDLKSDELTQRTFFPNPTPQLDGIQKEIIHYEREDGVKLTGTLYLPAGFEAGKDEPLPTLMWAYPREFKSADTASQMRGSPHRFTRVGWFSPTLFLTRGYAVLDGPALPIIGEGDDQPNDTFIEQLVSGATAAVNEVVRLGVTDRERIAVGGHSYGAFMTANLLAHCDLFRLGIAQTGAYNRSLTPFGFQSEDRTFWEAPEVYFGMSPFMHADKVDEPILMIHGQADNNPGTFPMQSERFYDALKGHGATVRLVMLPHESHSYRARENVMHVLWEKSTWLDRYVKNSGDR